MNSPSKSTQEQLLEAIELIETTLSNKTYMTRLRIAEVLERKHSGFRENYYLSNPNALLFILLGLRESGNIEMVPGSAIYTSERFEEGRDEPILYSDIPLEQSRTFFNEITFNNGFLQGKTYTQINIELMRHTQSTALNLIITLKKQGVTPYNVFYKRIDTPKNKTDVSLPALPVTID